MQHVSDVSKGIMEYDSSQIRFRPILIAIHFINCLIIIIITIIKIKCDCNCDKTFNFLNISHKYDFNFILR